MYRALWFLIETLGSLLATACVLRAVAARVQLSPRNPISQFVTAITEWLVRPLRGFVPASRGHDWASLAAALLVALVLAACWALMFRGSLLAIGMILTLAAYWLVKWAIYLVMGLVLLQAIMSWVNPNAPIAPAVDQLTRPFLAPLRRFIPLVGNVDLSPLALLLLLQVALTLLESLFVSIAALG